MYLTERYVHMLILLRLTERYVRMFLQLCTSASRTVTMRAAYVQCVLAYGVSSSSEHLIRPSRMFVDFLILIEQRHVTTVCGANPLGESPLPCLTGCANVAWCCHGCQGFFNFRRRILE